MIYEGYWIIGAVLRVDHECARTMSGRNVAEHRRRLCRPVYSVENCSLYGFVPEHWSG